MDTNNFIKKFKAGASLAPASLLYTYLLLYITDIITTYLITPDLKFESNYLFKWLNVNWSQLLLIYSSIVLCVIIGVIVSMNYLRQNIHHIIGETVVRLFLGILKNWKIFLCYVFIGTLYSHVINIGCIVLNNALYLTYLNVNDNTIKDFAEWYVRHKPLFKIYYQTIPILIGYILGVLKIREVKNKLSSDLQFVKS